MTPAAHHSFVGMAVAEKVGRRVHGYLAAAFMPPPAWIAAQTRLGVAGMSMCSMPRA